MPKFKRRETIETRAPTIVVDAGLPAGRHRFELVVFDDTGHRSKPATAVVEIQSASRRDG
jgi:hypothetical protein